MAHASLAKLPAFAADDQIHVVIETPSGSRTKYAFDPKTETFEMSKVLPLGTSFPFDFGFVPDTEADDGDPLDALVLADEPLVVGCVVTCRVLGAVECKTSQGKEPPVRNDRLITVPEKSIIGAEWQRLADLGDKLVSEITDFLADYTRREGRRFELVRTVERDTALALVREAKR